VAFFLSAFLPFFSLYFFHPALLGCVGRIGLGAGSGLESCVYSRREDREIEREIKGRS